MRDLSKIDLVGAIGELSGNFSLYGVEDERNRVCTALVRQIVSGSFAAANRESETESRAALRRWVNASIDEAVRFCRLAMELDDRAGFRIPCFRARMQRVLEALGESE